MPDEREELNSFRALARQFPLLSKAEEHELASAYRKGVQAGQKLRANRSLPPEVVLELQAIHQRGLEARSRFLNSNLRLVLAIAWKYVRWTNMTIHDLIQEGNIGLMRALDKFDPDRGFKFSTYATWWVRQAITRSMYQDEGIRIPIHRAIERGKVQQAKRWLEVELGRPPTEAEISSWAGLPLDHVHIIENLPAITASLSAPTSTDSEQNLEDVIEDDQTADAETAAILMETKAQVGVLLEGLSPRDVGVLMMRYGEEAASLSQIGERFHITREGVRQLIYRLHIALRLKANQLGL